MQRQIRSDFERALRFHSLMLIISAALTLVAGLIALFVNSIWIVIVILSAASFGFYTNLARIDADWLNRMDDGDYPVLVNFKDD